MARLSSFEILFVATLFAVASAKYTNLQVMAQLPNNVNSVSPMSLTVLDGVDRNVDR